MNSKIQQNEKGFTIIEVVLVLAIAALIFLMIFIALPALQRGQRDTARKQDANTVVTALNTWKGNHRGSLPNFAAAGAGETNDKSSFQTKYVKQLGQYDAASDTTFIYSTGAEVNNTISTDTIQIATAAQCDATGAALEEGSTRSAAVLVKLEASEAVVCIDS